jgi:DNA-binding cell septation regulator SpoVG
MAELNKETAARLWDRCKISLDRFHGKVVKHEKSIFLGYADITLDAGDGLVLKMRGVEVKNLKGNPHIDFPSERGADGQYYPQFFPKSAELRAVLTTAIFADERVQSAIESASQVPEQSTGTESSTSNPFS